MEKITLRFSSNHSLNNLYSLVVCLILNEKEKQYSIEYVHHFTRREGSPGEEEARKLVLPKRVLKAFTERAVDRILSKDEIPNLTNTRVLDGFNYEITITKGDVKKQYYANDVEIKTYPLLDYLATWSKNHQ